MMHSTDVSDIEQLGQTAQISDQSGTFMLLVKKNYKESQISDDSKIKSVYEQLLETDSDSNSQISSLSTMTVNVAASVVESVMISMDSLFVEDDLIRDTQLSSELKMKSVSGTKSS
ncbi:hypothetical protein LOZ57_003770 [Ophidiomyces ophidiicola]|uniref:uncharacterized protein n=1 Tax=Ophidiomyces ophidiicola TaxID=1387563 RepID=UPI0020C2CACF|nr:uncharacterized protein LOZ57_003770 [Ophidiomyces ophidiicola]KAI1946515.1 hypothetical protein LOZ57_003770 [Ophidiomyces ophidiicola]KAI2048350.1 hypothetical protein LOZ43_005405 [Ophidiomyces ophidiicola]